MAKNMTPVKKTPIDDLIGASAEESTSFRLETEKRWRDSVSGFPLGSSTSGISKGLMKGKSELKYFKETNKTYAIVKYESRKEAVTALFNNTANDLLPYPNMFKAFCFALSKYVEDGRESDVIRFRIKDIEKRFAVAHSTASEIAHNLALVFISMNVIYDENSIKGKKSKRKYKHFIEDADVEDDGYVKITLHKDAVEDLQAYSLMYIPNWAWSIDVNRFPLAFKLVFLIEARRQSSQMEVRGNFLSIRNILERLNLPDPSSINSQYKVKIILPIIRNMRATNYEWRLVDATHKPINVKPECYELIKWDEFRTLSIETVPQFIPQKYRLPSSKAQK